MATSPIGRDTPRVDGPLKVSGRAQYASDFHFPGMLHAVPVGATIASGRVAAIDAAAASKMPGVRAVFHRENIGKIFRSTFGPGSVWGGVRQTARAIGGALRARQNAVGGDRSDVGAMGGTDAPDAAGGARGDGYASGGDRRSDPTP